MLPNFADLQSRQQAVAVVGLGYVGLPLALAFAEHFQVIGFDVNPHRIAELAAGKDHTGEADPAALTARPVRYTSDPTALADAAVIVVAVPTPIDGHRNPDLTPVVRASETVGRHMVPGTVVVYESTVYPGVTEDECVPILARESGLTYQHDFYVGYSPERINPGDRVHTLANIVKIVSGCDTPTLELLAALYGSIIHAGIHSAASIRVAEAAKVIENTQRDLNIALMNELSLIFERMGIDTSAVLEAAGTKWNFLPFRPGLVGGHCIGVDPYYLTYKAEELGYHPQVILAGRRINDGMGKHVAESCVKLLIRKGRQVNAARVGILGLTFKEDVSDLRNSRVVDVARELEEYGVIPLVHDPLASPVEALAEYGITLVPLEKLQSLDAVILTVGHTFYNAITPASLISRFADPGKPILLDVKAFFNAEKFRDAGFVVWRL